MDKNLDDNGAMKRLLGATALAAEYCRTLENAGAMQRGEMTDAMLRLLPSLYIAFNEIQAEDVDAGFEEEVYFDSYVDEDYYESIRRGLEGVFGEEDTFLETFEEDMKYSDTPIASSISECLADIFQPLFNFVCIVRDSDGEKTSEAFSECKENFVSYWSQTLCNVMRALNFLKYN